MTEPTYDDLVAERAREWQDAQRRAAIDLDALREKLARMPGVRGPVSPWDTDGAIICECGGQVFTVLRYNSVNGYPYRAELGCRKCQAVGTWNFLDARWL